MPKISTLPTIIVLHGESSPRVARSRDEFDQDTNVIN